MIHLNAFKLSTLQFCRTTGISKKQNNFQNRLNEHKTELPSYSYGINPKIPFGKRSILNSYTEDMCHCFMEGDIKENKSVSIGVNTIVDGSIESTNNIAAKDDLRAEALTADFHVILGNNVTIEGAIESKKSAVSARNGLKANSITAAANLNLGHNANIKGSAVSTTSYIRAFNGIKAENLSALKGVILKENADISDSIITGGNIDTGDGLKVNTLIAGGNIILGSVDKLEEIHIQQSNPTSNDRLLILNSEEITPKKIKVYLSELTSLELQTPTGNKDILKKFEFIDDSSKEILNPIYSKIPISVSKIEKSY